MTANKIIHHIFHQQSLHQVSKAELEQLVAAHPYFAAAHLLLAQKEFAAESNMNLPLIKEARLYSSNQHYFNQFITQPIEESIREIPLTALPLEESSPLAEADQQDTSAGIEPGFTEDQDFKPFDTPNFENSFEDESSPGDEMDILPAQNIHFEGRSAAILEKAYDENNIADPGEDEFVPESAFVVPAVPSGNTETPREEEAPVETTTAIPADYLLEQHPREDDGEQWEAVIPNPSGSTEDDLSTEVPGLTAAEISIEDNDDEWEAPQAIIPVTGTHETDGVEAEAGIANTGAPGEQEPPETAPFNLAGNEAEMEAANQGVIEEEIIPQQVFTTINGTTATGQYHDLIQAEQEESTAVELEETSNVEPLSSQAHFHETEIEEEDSNFYIESSLDTKTIEEPAEMESTVQEEVSEKTGNPAAVETNTISQPAFEEAEVPQAEQALPIKIRPFEAEEFTGNELTFQPLYTEDYFAYKKLKSPADADALDEKGAREMKSFTSWLRQLKQNFSDKSSKDWYHQQLGKMYEDEAPEVSERVEKMAIDSITLQDDIISETLAEIWSSQKQYKKAISVYQKLSLLYPDKNLYFAQKIKDLELQIKHL